MQAGTTYYIKVGQFAGGNDAGTVVLNVEEGVPPLLPAKLVIESSVNGTSPPIRDVVAGFAATSISATQAGNMFDIAREIPIEMRPADQASRTETGIVGSQVAGKGLVKWNGPAELLQVFEGGENDDNWDVTLGTLLRRPIRLVTLAKPITYRCTIC